MRLLPILLALLLLAGTLAPGTAVSQADDELILRVAMQDDIKGTNPFVTDDDHWTILATQWMYDTPMFAGPDGLIPYIAIGSANVSGKAESWDDCAIGNFGYTPKSTWADAGKREAIIFYDFENVKWHNGTQMDVRDVMFSYHAVAQNPYRGGEVNCLMGENYSEDNWLHIEKVWESGNRAALRFTLQTPYWQFFNYTLAVRLLPEHVWAYKISGQNVDGAKIWCDAGYNQTATDSWQISLAQRYENPNPIGSGPLMWKNWTRGQWIDISTWRGHFFKPGYRYEEYCLDSDGYPMAIQPHIDGIHYRIYKTAEAAILALKSNDIDYIAWSVPPTFIQELANEPGISLQQSPNQGFTFVGYNMRKSSFGYKDGDPAKGDSGAAFRKAAAHCIDKNRITSRLLLCLGIAADGPISSISTYYNKTIPRYPFDPDGAKRILADAGYQVKRASDGAFLTGQAAIDAASPGNWWHNPDGTPIGSSAGGLIEIMNPDANYDPIRAQAGLMIAQQLRDVGIYAETMYDWGWGLDRIENRDFDICILPAHITSGPTDFMYDMFHSDNAVVGINYAGYRNSSFDSIMDTARSTDNGTVRKNAIFDAQASICYDLPYDTLYFRTNVEAYRSDRVRGWEIDASGTVFNIRSLRLITGPNPYKLSAQFVSPPSAVLSNSTAPITILVKDQDGNPVRGAQVLLNASLGSLEEEIGYTDSTGKFTALYTAPYASPADQYAVANGNEAIIQIKEAMYTDSAGMEYDPSPSRLTLVKVFPADVPFISLTLSVDPNIIDPDWDNGALGFAIADVHVTDQNGDSVAGASVVLHVSPDIPIVSPEEQLTDADGRATFTVIATDMPDNDNSVWEFVLVAVAVHPADANIQAENRATLCIVDAMHQPPPPVPPFSGYPVFEVTVTLVAILAAAGIYAAIKRIKKI